jgi:hypothetical protein
LALAPVVLAPEPDTPGDVVGLGAGLLGEKANDLTSTWLAGVEAVADEDDPAADLSEVVEEKTDLAHALARQAIELGYEEGLDAPFDERLDRSFEAGPPNVPASWDVEVAVLLDETHAVTAGLLAAHVTLTVGAEGVARVGERRQANVRGALADGWMPVVLLWPHRAS